MAGAPRRGGSRVLRLAMAACVGLAALVVALFAAASISAPDPGYPAWRRIAQAPVAVAAVLAFVVSAAGLSRHRGWVRWGVVGLLCTILYAVVAFVE